MTINNVDKNINSFTRIALDIGTTSIGWALLKTDEKGEPLGIIDNGVRIFSSGRDDKTESPLNQKRQEVRTARRNRDRTTQRQKLIINTMIKIGLMPENKDERKKLELESPYELRNNALNEILPPYHIGRALFHLSQRRGFQSNRKSEDGNEGGAIKIAIAKTKQLLKENNSKTIGQYLYKRYKNNENTRIRNISDKNNKFEYDFYLHRSMLQDEFDSIWHKQAEQNNELFNDENYNRLKNVIFYQRDLKSKKEHIGYCTLFYTDKKLRCARAMPSFQRFRIAEQLIKLEYIQNGRGKKLVELSPELFKKFFDELASGKSLSFKQMKKQMLKAGVINDDRESFNLESETFKEININETANKLAVKKKKDNNNQPILPEFNNWDLQKQNNFIEILLSENDDEFVKTKLTNDFKLTDDIAQKCIDTQFASGYGNLCIDACEKITDVIIEQGLRYDEAVKEAYPKKHHSNIKFGDEKEDKLPYYAKCLQEHCTGGHGDENTQENYENPYIKDVKVYGRIANPTVHVGLVQLQYVINDIISIHGKPNFATVEFANELKNNQKQKDIYKKNQKKNQAKNEIFKKEIEDLGEQINRDNMLRMRLWYELDENNINNRRCIYTGKQISSRMVLSSEVEIEHILPFSRTLDDSSANKTLSMRTANRYKSNRSPYDAFSESNDGCYDWDEIYTRAQKLPKNKKMRFNKDAMEKYKDSGSIKDRQLNDTRYLTKVAKKYLALIIPESERNINVIPGRLTAMLRGKWGLNHILQHENYGSSNKNRDDHRHHAIDAIVVGCTTRGMLQRVASKIGKNFERNDKLLADIATPWDNIINDVKKSIDKIIVSYKSDRYKQGRLHEESFYGKEADCFDKKGNKIENKIVASIRRPLSYFETSKKVDEIKDEKIKSEIKQDIAYIKGDIQKAVKNFASKKGIRRLKTIQVKENLIKIGDKKTKGYERYVIGGKNWCIDIYQKLNSDKWEGCVIQTHYANQNNFVPDWKKNNPTAKKIMRLHIKDLIITNDNKIMCLRKIDNSSAIHFYLHNESNVPKREKELRHKGNYLQASVSKLQELDICKVDISPAGRIQKRIRK